VTDEHARMDEDLAAYVLGSLEASAHARVEAHVATCATCATALGEYRAVVGTLPMGLDRLAPPPEAWTAIQAAARKRPRGRMRARAASLSDWLRLARWPAVATVVAALLVWNVVLQRELTRRAPGPAPGPEVEALSRRPGRVVILAGTATPGATARLFVASDGGHGHLAISGLTALPRERTYQLWFLRTDVPAVSGTTFGVDGRGIAWAKVSVPALDDVRAIVVTEEPAPGSVAPTGPPLLTAEPWR